MKLSHLISSLEETATVALTRKVRQLREEGRDIVGLTMGEPDFDTPPHIIEAAKKALDDGYTHYPPLPGYPELRTAIARKLREENGLDYSPSQILVSDGAKHSVYNIVMSLLDPGDHAVLPAPYWATNAAILHLAQADTTFVRCGIETDYKITPEMLEAALRPDTRLFYLTTPSNPSGAMYSVEEMADLVAVLERFPNCYILADEMYEYFTFGKEHHSIGTFSSIAERVITINGFSKSFAMTGWRLGYAAGPEPLIRQAEKLQGQTTSGAVSFAQIAAISALEGPKVACREMCDAFQQRRNRVFAALQEIDGLMVTLPEGAFYIYPDFSAFFGSQTPEGKEINDIVALCEYLLESEGVSLVPGTTFGTPNEARISFAYAQDVLEEGIRRMARGLARLKLAVKT